MKVLKNLFTIFTNLSLIAVIVLFVVNFVFACGYFVYKFIQVYTVPFLNGLF